MRKYHIRLKASVFHTFDLLPEEKNFIHMPYYKSKGFLLENEMKETSSSNQIFFFSKS